MLPASPGEGTESVATTRRASKKWRPLGMLLALLLLVGGLVTGGLLLPRQQADQPEESHRSPDLILASIERGKQALALGKVHLAVREFNEAIDAARNDPEALTTRKRRRLHQWQRQADLLSRLSPMLLEEIIQSGSTFRDPEEWATEFRNHYQGKTVVFDDLIARDADNRPILATYVVSVGDQTARVALEDLAILREIDLEGKPRLILGARLKSCTRERQGLWVVRFEENSGVLLTDKEAAACLPGGVDEEMIHVLTWQAQQLARMARVEPAKQ